MKPWIRVVAATAVAATALAGCSGESSSSDDADSKVVTIGGALGLTGDAAIGDVPLLAGIKYQIDKINAAGGVAGYTFDVQAKDMKSDSASGGTVAQELVDAGADILIGPAFPGMATGVIEVAGSSGIPVIAGASTQPEYTVIGGDASVFLAAFGDNVQAAGVAEYLLKSGKKTAVTVSSPDMTYTSNTPKFFADTFTHGGGTVLGDITFSIGQTDFSAQVTKIAAMDPRPDVIYTTMFPPDTPSFIRALRRAGVETPVAGADGFDTAGLLEAGGDALVGTVFSTHVFPTPDSDYAAFLDGPGKSDKDISDGPALGALGVTIAQIIAAAVEKAASNDPAMLTDALKELKDVPTMTGAVTYQGTTGIPLKPVTIGAVEDGAFVYKDSFVPSYISTP